MTNQLNREPTLRDLLERATINEVALNCVDFRSFYGMIGTSAVAAIASGQAWLIPAGVGLAFFDSYQRTKDANRKIREIETYPDRWMKYCGVPLERLLAADLDTPLADIDARRRGASPDSLPVPQIASHPGQGQGEPAIVYPPAVLENIAGNLTKHLLIFAPTQSGKSTFMRGFIRLIQKHRRPSRILYCSTKQKDQVPVGVEGYLMDAAESFYEFLQYVDQLRDERRKQSSHEDEVWIFVDEWESQIAAVEFELGKPAAKKAIAIVGRFLCEASGLGLKLGLITQSGNLQELQIGSGGKAANLMAIALGSENSGYDCIVKPHRSFGRIAPGTKQAIEALQTGYWIFAPFKGEQVLVPGIAPDPQQRLEPLRQWDGALLEPPESIAQTLAGTLIDGAERFKRFVNYEERDPNQVMMDEYRESLPEFHSLEDVSRKLGNKLVTRKLIPRRRSRHIKQWILANNLPLPEPLPDEAEQPAV